MTVFSDVKLSKKGVPMSDIPPRVPPGTEERRFPETRYSQNSMWFVLLVVAALVLAVIAFTVDRSADGDEVVPMATTPVGDDAVIVEPVPADTDPAEPEATPGVAAPESDPGTADPVEPAPGTTGGTTQPSP
jgi:hypothetical protein